MGSSTEELKALRETINNTPARVVVAATPIDLEALIEVKPAHSSQVSHIFSLTLSQSGDFIPVGVRLHPLKKAFGTLQFFRE